MAMLQRRFASSIYAVRRSLERMKEKREHILEDPEKYRQAQIARRLPEDFEELPEEEQQEMIAELEDVVVSHSPEVLREDIGELGALIRQAKVLEEKEQEVKVRRLKSLLTECGVFQDPNMKLLIFTEHKDTLDFLVGDGRDGRPMGKLREWNLTVTQIHGGMKIGDRDTPGTRIYAEREFRENCQVLVATEAAGEGINLQFCWLMVNYDIPWNPVRLEQRMGRIHRYGQEKYQAAHVPQIDLCVGVAQLLWLRTWIWRRNAGTRRPRPGRGARVCRLPPREAAPNAAGNPRRRLASLRPSE